MRACCEEREEVPLVNTTEVLKTAKESVEVQPTEKETSQGKEVAVITPRRDLPVLQIIMPINRYGSDPPALTKKKQYMQVNILLDTGSSVNLISVSCAKKLRLPVHAQTRVKIGTVNGVCDSKSTVVIVDFCPPRTVKHSIMPPFTFLAYTHSTLGMIPDVGYPIMPSFSDPNIAMNQYEYLNGIFPRKNEQLHMIVSQQDLTRFLWEGMRVYTRFHPNTYSISNFPELGEGYALFDTHWGNIWGGGGPKLCGCPDKAHPENHPPPTKKGRPQTSLIEEAPYELASKFKITEVDANEEPDEDQNTRYTTEDLVVAFKRMVNLDRLPMHRDEQPYTEEELLAIKKIEEVMHLDPVKKRMHTRLLLKDDVQLQNNYFAVKSRMDQLYKSFKMHPIKNAEKIDNLVKNWEMFQEYKVIQPYPDQVPWLDDVGPKNYMAMVVVVKMTSLTTPYRTCVEGNTMTGSGKTLNDNILVTPSLHMKIADIEARSRLGKYLLIADIKKLFLHMYIDNEDDRRLLRVLWKDPFGPEDAPWEVWAFTATIYGLKDSPYQLNTALHKCVNYWKSLCERTDLELAVASQFIKSLYVDDLTMTFNCKQTAKKAVGICSDIVAVGGFKFRKWISNDSDILESIPEQERAPHSLIIEHERGQEMERYVSDPTLQLGYRYNAATDEFVMDRFGQIPHNRDTGSKKGVASSLASIYDPLKLLGPFVLTAKRVMKETFRYKLDWKDRLDSLISHDDVIKEGKVEYIQEVLLMWQQWLNQLGQLEAVTFPRYIPNNRQSRYIVASDASTIGICACVHVITEENGVTTSHLLSSLCNITPLKTNLEKSLSIPLLELKGLSLAHDLGVWLIEELNVERSQLIFVSDSRVAIAWTLKDPEKLLSHIALVVRKIQKQKFTINFIHTEDNSAADMGSRGASVTEVNSSIWKNGPSWYTLPVSEHPYQKIQSTAEKYNIDQGLKKKYSMLESGRDVLIDGETEKIMQMFKNPENLVFSKEFAVTALFAKKSFEQKYGLGENVPTKKKKLGPIKRAVAKAVITKNVSFAGALTAENGYKGITCVIPALQYHGVCDWSYRQVTKVAALVFVALEKFREQGALEQRRMLLRAIHSAHKDRNEAIQLHCKTHFPSLNEEHRMKAQTYYIILSQWQEYKEEMLDLHKPMVGNVLPQVKMRSPLAGHSPHLQASGVGSLKIMCVTGRLDDDTLPRTVKHPPILSKRSRFAVLLIRHIHIYVFDHSNSLQTYNHLKREVYVPAGLQLVKKVLRVCVTCKKTNARRAQQLMGQLPRPFNIGLDGRRPERFQYVALDYSGAFTVYPMGLENKRPFKAYLAVWYCLYTKGYFITAVNSTDTASLLMAYDKLCTTFGTPLQLFSDNQPSFVKGASVIRERISHINQHIKSLHDNLDFDWHFGIAHDPQSLWERPIHEVKKCLYKIFKQPNLDREKATLNWDQLDLICRRIMFTLNERPLMATKQTSPDDLSFITPHRLIYGGDLSALPLAFGSTTVPFNSERQREMLRKVDGAIRQFQNIYQKHYIIEAKTRNFWNRRKPNIQLDDLVLIQSQGTRKYEKRSSWSQGRVVEIISGRDGNIRRVHLREKDGKIRIHPIHDLFPLIDASTRAAAEELNETR